MNKDSFKVEATKWRDWFYKGQRIWSVVHYATIFGAIIISVLAGIVLQLFKDSTELATILTTLAAALSSLAAAGGFERKWRSNRISRGRIDNLLLDIETDNATIDELVLQLKEIISNHDIEILGTKETEKK